MVTEDIILYALPDVQARAEAKINFGHQSSRRQTDRRVMGNQPPDRLGKRRKLKTNQVGRVLDIGPRGSPVRDLPEALCMVLNPVRSVSTLCTIFVVSTCEESDLNIYISTASL